MPIKLLPPIIIIFFHRKTIQISINHLIDFFLSSCSRLLALSTTVKCLRMRLVWYSFRSKPTGRKLLDLKHRRLTETNLSIILISSVHSSRVLICEANVIQSHVRVTTVIFKLWVYVNTDVNHDFDWISYIRSIKITFQKFFSSIFLCCLYVSIWMRTALRTMSYWLLLSFEGHLGAQWGKP